MSHTHLTLEERIRIELFVSMGLSCREMARRLGRSHSTLSRELRRNVGSAKRGYRAQSAERRAHKRRKRARHYRCMNRPGLIAWVDEKLRATGLPNRLQGASVWSIQRIKACVSVQRLSTAGSMQRHNSAIPATAICAVPTKAGGGKPGMARAGACSPGALISAAARGLWNSEPALGTGKQTLSVPPKEKRRCSAVPNAGAAFSCWPGYKTRQPRPSMRHSFPACVLCRQSCGRP